MKVPYRQGIVNAQTDSNNKPDFLQFSGTGIVSLMISPITALITFSSGEQEYLFEEQKTVDVAWDLREVVDVDVWLYWELDQVTGLRTFGYTKHKPIVAPKAPTNVGVDQHWFDTTTNQMKVLNDTLSIWSPKLRVFAGYVNDNNILTCMNFASQAGLSYEYYSGFILFDSDGKPIKKWRRDNQGDFYTTESTFATQGSKIANLRLDSSLISYVSVDNIPAYSAVCFKGNHRQVGSASSLDQKHDILGIVSYDVPMGELARIIHSGPITNTGWNWTVDTGTPLFIDRYGKITTDVPQVGAIQRIGYVIDADSIFIQIQPRINLINA